MYLTLYAQLGWVVSGCHKPDPIMGKNVFYNPTQFKSKPTNFSLN